MTIMSVEAKLRGQLGYSPIPMNPPPAEKTPNVIQFSLTQGCSHGRCTFCSIYEDNNYEVKTFPEFRKHVNNVLAYLKKNNPQELKNISRIFLGAGNALSVNTDLLLEASQYTLKALQNSNKNIVLDDTYFIPRRLAIYGNTHDILNKGAREMEKLNCGGTCGHCSIGRLGERRGIDVIYWGIESGDTDVLKLSGKGYSRRDILEAGDILNNSGVRISAMIMPGLGGKEYSETHVKSTVMILNYIQPEWITFIGLKVKPNTPYDKWIKKEEYDKKNRSLTAKEIAEQTARIIEGINFPTTIGLHGSDIHNEGYNPITIGSVKIDIPMDKNIVVDHIRQRAKNI